MDTAADPSVASQIMGLEHEYLLQNYSRYPIVLDRGEGAWLWDVNGKRYLDFLTGIGVNALGHAHPRIVRVIQDQAAKLIHTSNLYYNQFQGPLAKKLAEITGLERSFFCNSGAEAIEGAMKMARAHGRAVSKDKFEFVALENSFHGRTLGALSITGQVKYQRDFEPLLPGVHFIQANDLEALERVVTERTAGVVIEWIQGEGGILPISQSFAERARELADRFNALLIFDEIQCGVGRTGAYFAYQLSSPVLPDITVAAKPLACGLPLGVIVANERAASAIKPGMHGSTFGGSALSCRVAIEFFEILQELLPSIRRVGEYLRAQLKLLAAKHSCIREVRGFGLMVGVELDRPCKEFVLDAIENGLLINCTHESVIRLLPPYTITEEEVDQAIHILDRGFSSLR